MHQLLEAASLSFLEKPTVGKKQRAITQRQNGAGYKYPLACPQRRPYRRSCDYNPHFTVSPAM
jgi:hypothetical protein